MDFTRRCVMTAAAAVALSVPVSAQERADAGTVHGRQGFSGSLGFAFGSSTTQLSGYYGPDNGPWSAHASDLSLSLSLSAGTAVAPRWRVGGEVDFKRSSFSSSPYPPGTTSDALFVTGAVAFYPSLTSGLWLRANVGVSLFTVQTTVGSSQGGPSTETLGRRNGLAAGLGIGYDWHPAAGALTLVPFASYMSQLSDTPFSGMMSGWQGRIDLLQVGIGIGYSH